MGPAGGDVALGKVLADSLDHVPSSHCPRGSSSSSTTSLFGELRNALKQGRGGSLKGFEVKIQRERWGGEREMQLPNSQTLPPPSPYAPTELGQ